MGNNLVEYKGNNEELFVKIDCNGMDVNAKIIVPETHWVIIVRDGEMQETLEAGAYDLYKTTKNIFGKKKVVDLSTEVIYMSKGYRLNIPWGTPTGFDFRDPISGIPIHISSRGNLEMKINNPRQAYLELIGAMNKYDILQFQDGLIPKIETAILQAVAKYIIDNNLNYVQYIHVLDKIANYSTPSIKEKFEKLGLNLSEFQLVDIFIPSDSKAMLEEYYQEHIDSVRVQEENSLRDLQVKNYINQLQKKKNRLDKEQFMMDLKEKDGEVYDDVLSAIGWSEREEVSFSEKVKPNKPNYCPTCGYPVASDDLYCGSCGRRFE